MLTVGRRGFLKLLGAGAAAAAVPATITALIVPTDKEVEMINDPAHNRFYSFAKPEDDLNKLVRDHIQDHLDMWSSMDEKVRNMASANEFYREIAMLGQDGQYHMRRNRQAFLEQFKAFERQRVAKAPHNQAKADYDKEDSAKRLIRYNDKWDLL